MLDTDTKRRIDSARDTLVGIVPDPKGQVEQITIALIYKFMEDMDNQAEELGGHRKFFTGDFARYSWSKLLRSGLGGHETLNLYAEGILKMPENPGIPLLFRNIFKNAYLSYRNPETLKMFLKIIDEFDYDHSEKLGDAFEYLLSCLSSQGDAGQFRTPRHIIDFIVEIVDPKKNETILDPACGTAGFLISAYKHILNSNKDTKGNSTLTPDETGRIIKNLAGYDISHDMVRLSLVNMYLHGFTNPRIEEYDTLTSMEKWNEHADVILANPPFMSPKGGIRPHNRFSVQSKRSEVLFVDYMAEHLTPTGRAGIIVPEGIIFQSQNAYKQLRKMLVDEYLAAVVSLPAGVFNPYSGVKTSILILDKALAKKSNSIAFLKIENDGFGLGAQRRETEKNDLPAAATFLKDWFLSSSSSIPSNALIVEKTKIAANGEYNLSGERYREGVTQSTNYPWHRIESLVTTIIPPVKIQKTSFGESGRFPIIDQSHLDIAGWTDDEAILIRPTQPLVIFGDHTCCIKLVETPFAQGADGIKILEAKESLNPRYLYFILRVKPLESVGYNRHFSKLKEYEIPLPPLSVQQEIVAEIEGYQKVIDGARMVVENYKSRIDVKPEWEMVKLGEVCKLEYGHTESASDAGDARFIRITDITENGTLNRTDSKYITLNSESRESLLKRGDIVVARTGATYGKTMVFEEDYPAVFASYLIRLRFPIDRVLPRYYWVFSQSDSYWSQAKNLVTGGGQPQFNGAAIKQLEIPLPPLATQQAIVAEIEAERALVAANRKLIERMEKKIKAVIARVWGESLT
jgi:type I restriction enzyme M protein